jgi:uncharacterized membrane protein YedE/YeeE
VAPVKYLFLPLGALFGFLLSRAGATTYDYYAKLFLFEDLQLVWVIGTAVIVGILGLALLKRARARALLTGEAIELRGKPMTRELPLGALMLGVGWGLAAACPGTVLAMIGEGKLSALFTVLGIVLGTYAYGLWHDAKRVAR